MRTCRCADYLKRRKKATTYNTDKSRKKDDDDGADAHQRAVQSGLDYPFGESLQRDWEKLGVWEKQPDRQSNAVSDGNREEEQTLVPTINSGCKVAGQRYKESSVQPRQREISSVPRRPSADNESRKRDEKHPL